MFADVRSRRSWRREVNGGRQRTPAKRSWLGSPLGSNRRPEVRQRRVTDIRYAASPAIEGCQDERDARPPYLSDPVLLMILTSNCGTVVAPPS